MLKQGHPDYINASFVNVRHSSAFVTVPHYFQSYKHKRAFIVTQNPMKNTSEDFWKMIVERDCRAIVMLNPLQENGEVVDLCITDHYHSFILHAGGVLPVLARH